MNTQQFSIQKTARYQQIGSLDSNKLLVILHGYGQLAEYFIHNFQCLIDLDYCIIAPEGLHRFYLEGSSGRVGASWMTKEIRETDITDNLRYLDLFLSHFCEGKNFESISLLGFSQGGATALRWFCKTTFNFEKLIIWASDFPTEELSFSEISKLNQCKTKFVLGNKDPYFNEENRRAIIKKYSDLEFEIVEFQGTHKIDQNSLTLLLV